MREENGYTKVAAAGGQHSPEIDVRLRNVNGGKMDTQSSSSENAGVENTVALEKRVGLMSGIALIVGTMIGSGIFISPKGVLSGTGSVALSLIVWAGSGLIALFGKGDNPPHATKHMVVISI